METIKILVHVTAAVAVRGGSPRAGDGTVELSEGVLAALSEAERTLLSELLRPCERGYTLEGSALTLPSPDTTPEAVVVALRAALAQEVERRAASAAAQAQALRTVLAMDPAAEHHPYRDGSRALGTAVIPDRDPAGLAADLLGGAATLAVTAPAELRSWLAAARNATTRRETEARVAVILAADPVQPGYDAEMAMRGLAGLDTPWEVTHRRVTSILDGEETLPADCDPRVVAWVASARVIRDTARAEAALAAHDAAETSARRLAAVRSWACARSLDVRAGLAGGYDQDGLVRDLLGEVIGTALQLPGAWAPEVETSDPELPKRTGVRGPALAALLVVRDAAEKLTPELPEGVSLSVGTLSRQEYVEHSERCLPIPGRCIEDGCEDLKRTVVPVEVHGAPWPLWVIVPTE